MTTHANGRAVSRRGLIGTALGGGRRSRSAEAEFVVLDRSTMEGLAQRAISHSTADGCQVTVTSSVRGNTRFAANQLSTAGEMVDIAVVVESWFGPRHASVQINDSSDEAIAAAVARSEALAKLAPEDPEAMPALGPQSYQTVPAFFDVTAGVSAADRARAALTVLKSTRATSGAAGLIAAGYIVVTNRAVLMANKAGLSAYQPSTHANYTLTVRTNDGRGSGWAGADEHDWSKINPDDVAQRAMAKARQSHDPVAVEPGRYTVILEAQAVGDLVQLIMFSLNARLADEGRSPFVNPSGGSKIGQRVVDSKVTLFSDVADPQLLSNAFDAEGYPLGRQVWIQDGTLANLSYSRFWAHKQGKPFTGQPNCIKVAGGTTAVDDMIKSTDRGILVTRFWYLRPVDPRTALYTGLTRDGTFLIENGAISHPVKNFRFNDSPIFLLNNVEAIGPSVRLAGTEIGGDIAMPTLKAHDFNFTSLSDAV